MTWTRIAWLVGKPFRWLARWYHGRRYDAAAALAEQERGFAALGLSRPDGEAAVAAVLAAHPGLAGSMQSEHHVVFGALSRRRPLRRILEIGTYDGKAAALLARLFPDARIDTIDLPDDHPAFTGSYNRAGEAARRSFIERRDALLAGYPTISFQQLDSVALTGGDRAPYDLVWVDGDHGYPTVVIDILNALRLLADDGVAMCDDVLPVSPGGASSIYRSDGAHRTLLALQAAGMADFRLVYKRLAARANANPGRRKFVAVFWRAGR